MPDVIPLTVNALLLASLYATMSYGLALIWGVMKVINLAHAGMIMLGAYLSFWLFVTFGLDPLLSIPFVAAVFLPFGMGLERLLVRRLEGARPVATLLLLFGVWLVLQNAGYLLFTGDTRSILTSYTYTRFDVMGIGIAAPWLAVFVSSLVVLLATHLFLAHTDLGKAIRAASQNREACQLVGIDVRSVSSLAFGMGSALAAVAGTLLALVYPFNPEFGGTQQLKAFCIIVLGGLGSFVGVGLGALVLALAEVWSVHFGLYAALQNVVSFALLVAVLVLAVRPLLARLTRGYDPDHGLRAGFLALVFGGIRYTKREKVLQIGPVEATTEKHEMIPLSPIVGIAAVAVALQHVQARRRAAPGGVEQHHLPG